MRYLPASENSPVWRCLLLVRQLPEQSSVLLPHAILLYRSVLTPLVSTQSMTTHETLLLISDDEQLFSFHGVIAAVKQ